MYYRQLSCDVADATTPLFRERQGHSTRLGDLLGDADSKADVSKR